MIAVEVVAALPEQQRIVKLRLEEGATAADALTQAKLDATFPEIDFQHSRLAVWGQPARRDQVLRDGDRVEVLRPLTIDPRDARRELAKAGRSMGAATSGCRQRSALNS